ncbi:transcription factor Jun-like [Tachysurus ichikawai]
MDGLFYNEALDGGLNHHLHHLHHHHGSGYEALTRNMSLNLSDAPHDALTLTSPDLQLLKLTSPELERLLIQTCNGSAPSTPTSGPARTFSAPKQPTDERDAFALEEFQCHQRMCTNPSDVPAVATGPSHACSGFAEQVNHTWDTYTDAPPCAPPRYSCAPGHKDEPQKVPETPPLSPIDMEDQERIKAERKRMRNRVAASKCRKRKLERLARLEERVSRLTGENGDLRGAAESLRDQVTQLRHQLLDHIKSGCKLLSQQLQTVKEF